MALFHCWIETKSPGSTEWQHYEQFEEEEDPPGVYLADSGMHDNVDALAQAVLRNYLASVLHTHADRPDVQVRTYAQVCDKSSVSPSAIRQASPDDIAEARETLRLEALTRHLRSACHSVYEARSSVETAIVRAHDEGLDLHTISRVVMGHLDAQSVARLIDAPALLSEVQDLICTRPELAGRTRVRKGSRWRVEVELRWTNEEHDAEELRWRGWNETIEEYDPKLAAALLSAARSAASELLALLATHFEVTPATPHAVAPAALVYHPVTVQRRPAEFAASNKAEEAAA